ncbi:uncharacterized protein Tco025E_00028, partial [Trypanosoma conorhini]
KKSKKKKGRREVRVPAPLRYFTVAGSPRFFCVRVCGFPLCSCTNLSRRGSRRGRCRLRRPGLEAPCAVFPHCFLPLSVVPFLSRTLFLPFPSCDALRQSLFRRGGNCRSSFPHLFKRKKKVYCVLVYFPVGGWDAACDRAVHPACALQGRAPP